MIIPSSFVAKNPIQLLVITPHGVVIDQKVDLVTVTTSQGQIGLLHGRMPFVASLLSGAIRYHTHGQVKTFTTTGGLVYSQPQLLKIISDQVTLSQKV